MRICEVLYLKCNIIYTFVFYPKNQIKSFNKLIKMFTMIPISTRIFSWSGTISFFHGRTRLGVIKQILLYHMTGIG